MRWESFRSRRRTRRGFTLVEVMISMGISSVLMVTVAYLMLFSARSVKNLYNLTRVRSSQMRALDQVRYRIANGVRGTIQPNLSTGDEDNGYREITYSDPTLGPGNTSKLSFIVDRNVGTIYEEGTLYYDALNDGNAVAIAQGPVDVRFARYEKAPEPPDTPPWTSTVAGLPGIGLVVIKVRSQAFVAYREIGDDGLGNKTFSVVDEQDGVTKIALRNPS